MMLTTILIASLLCFVSAFDNPLKDPEIAPEVAKIKTKLCDANVRPTDAQWTAIQQCGELGKASDEDLKKMGESIKICTDMSKDVSSLLTNNLRKDIWTYQVCSDQYQACEEEQVKKAMDEAEKNGNKMSDEDQKTNYEKTKKKCIDIVACTKKALGIE